MSTLKVNKLRDTAGSTDAITLDPNGGAVLAGVTTVSTVKVGSGVTISSDGDVFTTGITTSSTVVVGSGVTISESGIEASGIGITCANINGTQIGGRRNIIINGDMRIAQRGTSTTTSGGYAADRLNVFYSGTDEAPTFAQADVSSGTTPYTLGFRKCLKVTNGNQTSGAGAADYVWLQYKIEAQDIANSGWNYTSTSSFITLSFWVKSSVAQDFKGWIQTYDGTGQSYPYATGSLTADTWTKITKTIPGNSNLQFDNDANTGLQIHFLPFFGTDYTASSATENAWQAYSGTARCKDSTSTWYTTNDATWEITGLQLEVGSQATAFEHRSLGEELDLCTRYCQVFHTPNGTNRIANLQATVHGGGSGVYITANYKPMRAVPSVTTVGTIKGNVFTGSWTHSTLSSIAAEFIVDPLATAGFSGLISATSSEGSLTTGKTGFLYSDDSGGSIIVHSEL